MRSLIAAALLTVPLWSQSKPLSTEDASQQVREIQTALQSQEGVGDDFKAFVARREKIFDGVKEIVSRYAIGRIEAAPDIKWWELRDGLIRVLGVRYDERLGPDNFHQPPYVFRIEPPYLSNKPVMFSVVYDGEVYIGSGGARIVVESYVLDKGKARLAGRGGSELNGVEGGAQQVDNDELLVQGQFTWASGHVLPYEAALYRVSEAGVRLVWKNPDEAQYDMRATVFGGNLFVEYRDPPHETAYSLAYGLDVYFLDKGVPKLAYHRDWQEH